MTKMKLGSFGSNNLFRSFENFDLCYLEDDDYLPNACEVDKHSVLLEHAKRT